MTNVHYYQDNWNAARDYCVNQLGLAIPAAEHFAGVVADNASVFEKIDSDYDVISVLHEALAKQFQETKQWDEYLPRDILEALHREGDNIEPANAIIYNWLRRPHEHGAVAAVTCSTTTASTKEPVEQLHTVPAPYYRHNYELAFEFFYVDKELDSVAAAHFAELAVGVVSDDYASNKQTISDVVFNAVMERYDDSNEWDGHLPEDLLCELKNAADSNDVADLVDKWLHVPDEAEQHGEFYDDNYELAFEFFYVEKELDSEAAAHFAQIAADRVRDDYQSTEQDITDEVYLAIMKHHDETGEWDEYLPADVLAKIAANDNDGEERIIDEWLCENDDDEEEEEDDERSDEEEEDDDDRYCECADNNSVLNITLSTAITALGLSVMAVFVSALPCA